MKRENNKKFKKRKRNQNRSLTCRVLSMMFAIVLFCSTVLINTDYVSQASSFDDMVDMVEVEEDSAAVDTSEDTGDDLGTDVNFESEESTDETYSESDDLGSSDVDFSSGENMFTDGTSESSAPAEEAAQPVSCIVNLKNETIEIKAEAPAGVLPNGTQMSVKAVENNTEDAEMTDQYNKLAAKITEQLQSQGKNLDGFLAYNVSFTDADGNPVEPAGKVNYSFTYKEASSPELTDPAASTVTAAMIRTNKETSELELTELKAEEDQLTVETNESRQLTKAAFQSAATAAFTFVWSSTPAADDNEKNEENGEVNNEEVKADTNTENTEENGEETNTENNVENSEEEQNPEEAPDQEQIKMIRITADEVNLRVSPSTEADVIATVDTDTQLPLLETVTDEDEFTWYKVSYEEAEAYVRSDMAEVVETEEQDVVIEEDEEADQTVTYESTVDGVKIVVTAPDASVLPENAELVATKIDNTEEIEQIKDAIAPEVVNNQTSIKDLMAFDIKFMVDDEEVQPNGEVKVEFQNTGYDTENGISVYHVDDEKTTATDMQAVVEEKTTDTVMQVVSEEETTDAAIQVVSEEGEEQASETTGANVAIDTTHFSTYVVVNNGDDKINVTIQHYLYDTATKTSSELYKEKTLEVASKVDEGKLSEFTAENDEFRLRTEADGGPAIVKIEEDGTSTPVTEDRILVDKNVTIRCYYVAETGKTYTNSVTMFDYDITSQGSKLVYESFNYNKKIKYSIIVKNTEYAGFYKNGKLYKKNDYKKDVYTFKTTESFTYAGHTCTWIGNNQYTYYEVTNTGKGINTLSNYSNQNSTTDKMMMGQKAETGLDYTYYINGYNINNNNKSSQPIIPGIVTSLSDENTNYSQVNFKEGIDEPGFFSSESKTGKRILDNYYLNFAKTGNKYTLESVSKKDGTNDTIVANDLKKFWPLDNDPGDDGLNGGSDDGGRHNWYFAMRYDFKFRLGDYMGDLTYSFNGDDDLWVFMDGQPIIDLGGLHSAYPENDFVNDPKYNRNDYDYSRWTSSYPNTVDLWTKIDGGKDGADREKEHTITVLFMERGGFGSNCNMEFVLPNVTSTEPVISTAPKAVLKFTKQDINTKDTIDGAEFTLYRTNTDGTLSDEIKTETSKDGGNVKFTGLKAGIYYLKETKVVDGYLPSNSIYTVVVTNSEDGNSATAVLKNSKDKAIDVIYNQKYENVVETGKTAQLVDWDARTYNITLNASSKAQDISETDPVEVVLVLDTSGSMHFRSTLQPYKNCTVAALEGEGPYYYVTSDPAATMYRVYKSKNNWYYIDDSKWDYFNDTGTGTTIPKNSKEGLDLSDSFQFYTTNDDNDRFYYLKKAATEFTTELESLSADSKVALVTFNSEAEQAFGLKEVGSNLSSINNTIQSMGTKGGTAQYLGLEKAEKLLKDDENTENLKRYVILLTDGCPNGSTYQQLEDSASALKNKTGATLMTIGVGMGGSNTYLKEAEDYLKKIASDNDGTKYAYTVDANQLSSIFRSILQSVAGVPVPNVTVKDYIDPRFDVIESSVTEAGGIVGHDTNGRTYVIWQNETIGVATGSSSGWKKTFQVKAKPEYIGGNDVTTNGDGSGVFVGDKEIASFGKPTVNVKVDFNIGSNETVIFKGDDLSEHFTDNIENEITKLVPTTGATEYTMVDDVEISTEWYTDEACTTKITKEAIQAASPTEDTVYYAKVTVTPKTNGSASSANSVGDGKADGGYYKVDSAGVVKTGTYTVKVVFGQIQIIKKLDAESNTDTTFTFDIKKGANSIATATAIVAAGNKEAKVTYQLNEDIASQINIDTTDTSILTGLARGEYTITETPGTNYTFDKVEEVVGTNCKSSKVDNGITFTMGTYTTTTESGNEEVVVLKNGNNEQDKGRIGVAEFTNKKSVVDIDFEKVDIQTPTTKLAGAEFALYKADANGNQTNEQVGTTYTSDSNGGIAIENLPIGKYVLVETKAPTGYQCSAIPWKIEVENDRTITVTYNGNRVEPSNNIYQLTNTKVYSLPEAGGNGIYWYMISGMVLMSTAAWILYKNKCKEVLRK